MVTRWSENPKLLRRLLELDARELTHADIAIDLFHDEDFSGVFTSPPTTSSIKHALEYAREKVTYLSDSFIPDRMPYYSKYRSLIEGDDILAKNTALLSSIVHQRKRSVLVLADIHVPFTDETKLQKAVELNRAVDLVVIVGDTMDQYSCSRWRKRQHVPLESEIDGTVRLFEYLAREFPAVLVLPGNHDMRTVKKIQELLPPELFFLFDNDGPLEMVTRAFDNVFYHPEWYYQLGDTVFTHAERSSSYEGRPAVLTAEYFLVKGWQKRMKMGDIRCVIQAHNHQASAVYREDLKLMQVPCMANVMEYTVDAAANMRPPMNGFIRLVQVDGQTDFNLTREWVL